MSDSGGTLENRWRFLVGMGIAPERAQRFVEEGVDVIQASMQRDAPIVAPRSELGDELDDLLVRLGRLPDSERAAVLANALGVPLGDAPSERLDAAVSILTIGDRSLDDVLAPLLSLDPPHLVDPAAQRRRGRIAAVGLLALATTVIAVAALQEPTADTAELATPPTTVAISTTTSTTTTTTTLAPTPTWIDPDRELEVFLTDRNTVVRLEPWTRRLLWESRPFRDPTIVSIDPNTVTLDSAGNRLIVSLTDGTLLPP